MIRARESSPTGQLYLHYTYSSLPTHTHTLTPLHSQGLPESTYAYLTVSTSGTIFVIAPINGDLWQTEKVRVRGSITIMYV